jgi:pyruvate dehydrogenase E1 component
MPKGSEEGIIKGMHLIRAANPKAKGRRVQLMGCGAILREVIAGADLLEKDFGITADIWSVTSFTELKREAHDCERWNMLHPGEPERVPYVTQQLAGRGDDPVIASTDYMKLFADQIRPFVPAKYRVLGTDGYGRSDYRKALRAFFEVDRHFVAVAALKALADENKIPSTKVAEAIKKYAIDPEKNNPART